jgi:hypothetical protein
MIGRTISVRVPAEIATAPGSASACGRAEKIVCLAAPKCTFVSSECGESGLENPRILQQFRCGDVSTDSVDRGKVIRVQMHLSPVIFFSLPLPANRFPGLAA